MQKNTHYLKNELLCLFRCQSSLSESIVEKLLDGVWYWDLEKPENEWMSPGFWRLLGFDPDKKKHLVSEYSNLRNEADAMKARANLDAHCKDPNVPYEQISRYRHKDNSTVWIRSRGFAIQNENGKAVRMLGSYTDLTNLKNEIADHKNGQTAFKHFMNQIKRSNEALDDFGFIVSHDLREPLRGIASYADFLQEDSEHVLDPASLVKIATIKKLTVQMESLIESLFYYSRFGRTELSFKKSDLNKIVNEVLLLVQAQIQEKNIEIRIPIPLPTVYCDPVWISAIYRNLILNACKYNDKPNKWVEIGFEKKKEIPETEDANDYIFHVKDNGIGIHEKHHAKIFKIFKRLHAKDKYGGGAGSGLAIVKKFVERHGGKIWLDSIKNAGATFYFTFASAIDNGFNVEDQLPLDMEKCIQCIEGADEHANAFQQPEKPILEEV